MDRLFKRFFLLGITTNVVASVLVENRNSLVTDNGIALNTRLMDYWKIQLFRGNNSFNDTAHEIYLFRIATVDDLKSDPGISIHGTMISAGICAVFLFLLAVILAFRKRFTKQFYQWLVGNQPKTKQTSKPCEVEEIQKEDLTFGKF